MKITTGVPFLAILLVTCAGAESTPRALPDATQARPYFIDRSMPAQRLEAAPASDRAKIVDAEIRVRADRRFLIAIGDVEEILTGKRIEPEIAFENGHWTIHVGDRQIGTLPELPSFADGLELVTHLAASLPRKPSTATPVAVSGFYAPALFSATKTADPAAGSIELAEAAALINLQTIDRFGLADPLRGRALALLAIARASHGRATDDIAALLADSFGYETEAHIPTTLSQDARLYASARQALRNAKPGDRDTVTEPLLETLPAEALPLFTENSEMGDAIPISLAAARMMAAEVAGEKSVATTAMAAMTMEPQEIEKSLSIFENALGERVASLSSRAFPPDVVRAYYEALFHSMLYTQFDTLLNRFNTRQGSTSYVEHLGTPTTAVATQVRDWMSLSIAAEYDRGGTTPANAALLRIPLLGGAVRAALLLAFSRAAGAQDRQVRLGVHLLFPLLDSRPSDLLEAGRLAYSILGDPMRRDCYLGTAIDRAPSTGNSGFRGWYYALIGDEARLREVVESTSAAPADRAIALRSLGKLPNADHTWVTARFERLLQETGYDDVYSQFVAYINDRRDWKTKERVIRKWFDEGQRSSGTGAAYYASSLALALEKQGRYDEEAKVIEPYVNVGSGNILAAEMSVHERRGDVEGAVRMGRAMIARYPDVKSRADFAAVLWRRGRNAEAADLFKPGERLSSSELRVELPIAFAEAFETRPIADGVAAAQALAGAGVDPYVILDILGGLEKRGRFELVHAIAESLIASGGWNAATPQGAALHITAWQAMKGWKGPEAATAWLQPRVADGAAMQFISIAYQDREYDLVLAYASPRPEVVKSLEVLAFMAAALTHQRAAADDPRRIALIEKVRAAGNQPQSLLPVAQYLLGLTSEEDFLKWPYDASGPVIAAYFVGLKSAADGNYEKALPWLIAASEGRPDNPPTLWAVGILWRWVGAGKSWPEIARAGIL